jgi:hypothetical protein
MLQAIHNFTPNADLINSDQDEIAIKTDLLSDAVSYCRRDLLDEFRDSAPMRELVSETHEQRQARFDQFMMEQGDLGRTKFHVEVQGHQGILEFQAVA